MNDSEEMGKPITNKMELQATSDSRQRQRNAMQGSAMYTNNTKQ